MGNKTTVYDKTIRTIREVKTIPKHMAALGMIRIESEDLRLTSLIEGVLSVLHFFLQQGSSKSAPLALDLVPTAQAWDLLLYCQTYKAQKKPEWQVIAEREGWRSLAG
jgi:hypothetical protein